MSIFNELVVQETAKNRLQGTAEIPFSYSEKLGTVLNAIQRGRYYTIAGRDGTGKRSFVDLHFLLGPYIWWLNTPEGQPKPKLKILYFSMNKPLKIKLQKWLSSYFWIYLNQLIDVNTLNGSRGKLYNLNEETVNNIAGADKFFDYLINESGILEIFDGPLNPTGVYNEVASYMKKVGGIKKEGFNSEFVYDAGYEDQITLVIVDSVKHLKNESKGGQFYDEGSLHKKFNEYLVDLRNMYKVTPVVIVPSFSVAGIYKLNQMKPDFRELRQYFEDSNAAIHLMNPFKLQMDSYESYQMKDYISPIDAIPRFRLTSILRNTDGRDSIHIANWFIPENGIFYDLPAPQDPALMDTINYIQTFKQLQISQFI